MKKLWLITAIMFWLVYGAPVYALDLPEGKHFYTELTCDPKQDVFSAYSKVITQQELEGKFDARSVTLRTHQFSVLLNGKLVGEKAFKDICKLKQGITVEVDVNYDTVGAIYCNDDIPEKYLPFKKHEDFKCIVEDRGNYFIKDSSHTLAAISTMLFNPTRDFILKNGNLTMYYNIQTYVGPQPAPENMFSQGNEKFFAYHSIVDNYITLKQMQKKPLLMKSTPDPATLVNDFQEVIK